MTRRSNARRLLLLGTISVAISAASAATAFARTTASGGGPTNPLVLVVMLGALSLAPFVLIMLTSFVKISVVLSILRNALGTQQAPPNQVITGLSFVLSMFIMMPVIERAADAARSGEDSEAILSAQSLEPLLAGVSRAKEPVRDFLTQHCHQRDRDLFHDLSILISDDPGRAVDPDSFQLLIPAFVTSELKEAFLMGFVMFIPFLVVDMVIANVLMSLGMMMLSPTVISLPFKLLLFVLVDGWFLTVRSLVLTYT